MIRSRRPHTKSKLGCKTCKQRRIKCDENRPDCQRCKSRGLSCDWAASDQSRDPSVPGVLVFRSSSPSFDKRSSITTRLITDPEPRHDQQSAMTVHRPRVTNLTSSRSLSAPSIMDWLGRGDGLVSLSTAMQPRLGFALHHFVRVISPSMTPMIGQGAAEVWVSAIMSLSATYKFVLEGVISVTSLHLARNLPSESERSLYTNLALDRMNRGLSEFRTEVSMPTDKNTEALFTFHNSLYAFVCSTSSAECKSLLESLYTHTTESLRSDVVQQAVYCNTKILRCLRGGVRAITPHWRQLQQGRWAAVVKQDWASTIFPAHSQAIEEDKRLQELESMWLEPDRQWEDHFSELARALQQLRTCYALCSLLGVSEHLTSEVRTSVLLKRAVTWIFRLSQEFLLLLDRRLPEAWVLFAHHAILLERVKPAWWLHDTPDNIVMTAAMILNKKRWSLLAWPAMSVGLDLDDVRRLGTTESPRNLEGSIDNLQA